MALKVGDKLAFREGWGGHYRIYTISKITPSGRIVCGRYTLNPDLTVRGRSYGWPFHGEIPTPEIKDKVLRERLIKQLNSMQWNQYTTAELQQIVNLAKTPSESSAWDQHGGVSDGDS